MILTKTFQMKDSLIGETDVRFWNAKKKTCDGMGLTIRYSVMIKFRAKFRIRITTFRTGIATLTRNTAIDGQKHCNRKKNNMNARKYSMNRRFDKML